jgi:hypothetical protein
VTQCSLSAAAVVTRQWAGMGEGDQLTEFLNQLTRQWAGMGEGDQLTEFLNQLSLSMSCVLDVYLPPLTVMTAVVATAAAATQQRGLNFSYRISVHLFRSKVFRVEQGTLR